LEKHYQEFTITEVHPEYLRIDRPGMGDHQLFLQSLFAAIEGIEGEVTQESRDEVFAKFAESLWSGERLLEMTGDDRLKKVMPRLMHRIQIESMEQQVKIGIPNIPIENTPLCIAFVIDMPQSVAFVNHDILRELGVTLDDLHAAAVEHLDDDRFGEVIRTLEPDTLGAIKTGDSYDAARALLIPKYLEEGQSILIAIPDRDSLMLLRSQSPGRFELMSKVAKFPGSDRHLYDGAIEVTAHGFRACE
jgi:uncharacterized protein YtpQ (UPF0354 family)